MDLPSIVLTQNDEKFYMLYGNAESRSDFKNLFIKDLSDFFSLELLEHIDFESYEKCFYDLYSYNSNKKDQDNFEHIIVSLITYILTKLKTNELEKIKNHILEIEETELFIEKYSINFQKLKELIFLALKEEERIFLAFDLKKNIKKVMQEIPMLSFRVLSVSLGRFTDEYGKPITLEEYANTTNMNYEELKQIETNSKKLVFEKIKNRRMQNGTN